MELREALLEFAKQQQGRPIKEACDLLAFHASQAFAARISVTHRAVDSAPVITLAEIAKLVATACGKKLTVREAYIFVRGRMPSHGEAIAVGRVFAKLFTCTKRGPTSVYEIAECDRATLLDAGVIDA